MRGWSRAQLLFANHRRILQIKHVWGSLTTCHLLSPRLDNEDGRTPGKTRDYFFFSLLYQKKKKPRNKKTRYDILSECCCRPTDAPTALFVYDLPTQSLCMYLPWLCSTCDNCLPMHLSVCLCVCETLTPGTPYEKVQVCAVQGTKSVLFAAHISPCVSIGEGNKGPDGVFGAAQVSPFCQSAPLPLLKLLQLSRAQHLSRKKKKLKRPHHGLFSQAPWRHCSLTRWNQNSSRLEGSPWSARPRMRWFAGSRLLRHLQWMNATLIVFEVRLRGCLE